MNYKKYTEGIIFIDDREEEVREAIKFFNDQGIDTLFFKPLEIPSSFPCLGYNFVFLDLSYDGKKDIKTAVVSLLRIAEMGEKHFVVIAWTQHQDEIESLEEEIKNKMSDCFPLKVLNGEKFKILNRDETLDFSEMFSDIINKLESENPLLFKLLEWKKNMTCSVNEIFNKLVEKSYVDSKIDLNRSLGLYANKTLSKTSMLSALDTLNKEVNNFAFNKLIRMEDIALQYDESGISIEEKMSYNYERLFSEINSSVDIPGSIYMVGNERHFQELKDASETKKQGNVSLSQIEIYYEILNEANISFESIVPVKVNITPNCTFASPNSINTTYLDGIIIKGVDKEKLNKVDKNGFLKKNGSIFYKYMDVNQKMCILKFFPEFCSYLLENGEKIYQLNNDIKVEIQHSFGSWVSRVGNILY